MEFGPSAASRKSQGKPITERTHPYFLLYNIGSLDQHQRGQ
ncbi:hypothetical protein Enr10x_33610 [Gimesia panareensis]|uniref:Uncharacterized protein n=1 Tax=Gimesia panareensis TaxID=2527978 RepID=A0A518A831_9PLAN|nr:hypothetical protein Enr10x_33610 [Gimesia panareensis]QDU50888.1 hypothetical protein Pan110_32490 [Gimesia panareensis]